MPDPARPLAAAIQNDLTSPCVEAARRLLEADGFDAVVFQANGVGGVEMEKFVRDGRAAGVLDLTTAELAAELVGGGHGAGPDRLTAAGLRGVPQVISLGGLDAVTLGPAVTLPERFRGRRLHRPDTAVTLLRTTPEENDQLGKEIAHKASAARGPTAVLVPLRGLSALDVADGPFWWPAADAALVQSLRTWMSPHVEMLELDSHLNDPAFAAEAVRTLRRLLGNPGRRA